MKRAPKPKIKKEATIHAGGKWPRDYASEICMAHETLEQMVEAISDIPLEFQDIVSTHVVGFWYVARPQTVKQIADEICKLPTREKRLAALDKVEPPYRASVKETVIDLFRRYKWKD